MNRARRLVKSISGFQKATWLAVDCKFVRPLDYVAERMVARVPMRSTARPRLSIQKAYAHFSPKEIGERCLQKSTCAADHPNVNANASTPGLKNSIWNSRSAIGGGWRIS